MSDRRNVSSTFTKRTETDVPAAPGSAPSMTAPRRPPVVRIRTNEGEKNTIALGEGDLEPVPHHEPLAIPNDFSIRRGVVLCGRFRVKELIGAGAQCYVYSAEHTTLKSQVAIKCLQPALVTPDLVERFAREAQALTAIRNAHVAAVLDVGRAPCGTPFIVMEFLQGRDLGALLETRPRLEQRQATEILLQTCEGLAAAHALGLVHQDIKPSNIFLSDEMGIVKAKVVDFGVARVTVDKSTVPNARLSRSWLDDEVGGTPFYMSPEQLNGRLVIDARSDIFSLGMVLYEMLRGTNAFDLEMSTRRPEAPVRIERTGIDPGLIEVIEKCLAHHPDDRYPSVAELAVALLPFAPSRGRAHAEAATALLRKAGHSVASTLPSSVPPPARSLAPAPVSLPPPPALPGTYSASLADSSAKRRSTLRLVLAGTAIAALAAGGAAAFVASRARTPTAAAATAATNASTPTASPTAIGISPAVRTQTGDDGDRAALGSATTTSAVEGNARGSAGAAGAAAGAGAAAKPYAPASAGAPFGTPGAKASANASARPGAATASASGAPAANGSAPGAPPSTSAKAPSGAAPTPTGEDLGF